MDKECYNNGQCKLCGCETTALQMANKGCDKPCYPAMLDESDWKVFSSGSSYNDTIYLWKLQKDLSLLKKKL
jgi:hypothetical protein